MQSVLVLSLLLSTFLSASAQSQGTIREFPPETVAMLGQQIHRHDNAAWRATDLLFAQGLDLAEYESLGWVSTEEQDGILVTFVGEVDGDLVAIFDIRPDAQANERFRIVSGRPLTSGERARFAAISTAASQSLEGCSENYNTVVLKDPEADAWLVYLLAATTEPDVIVVGGHYRMTVSGDGSTLLRTDKLFRSCLRLPSRPQDLPQGTTPVALYMTHVVSESPVEPHVFLNLQFDVDFMIETPLNGATWFVSEGVLVRR